MNNFPISNLRSIETYLCRDVYEEDGKPLVDDIVALFSDFDADRVGEHQFVDALQSKTERWRQSEREGLLAVAENSLSGKFQSALRQLQPSSFTTRLIVTLLGLVASVGASPCEKIKNLRVEGRDFDRKRDNGFDQTCATIVSQGKEGLSYELHNTRTVLGNPHIAGA